ncbi:hypothetical protein CHGG_06111 [Chaetomium globosum CBS 148.51]|uniref:Uncharacterized protein n=1 Tax=Chaetomium globosum (strain ATCC 6205 / CBS 148.51 / DSM 1962 / NBRC 6347 / NRRL 1970) TaxID=306901 RepID=Q2H5F4_CHAGB|nr:uncharacterized protein CHGG_06111 [Chaetomium globosum CBS 148.51]EAQ89492.1 hypothetical protein CHGG_06111 [Chaetomium globosum CBS 148.51]
MAPITEDKTVTQILTGPSTWVSWHREFTNTMDALKLLEYFQGTKELLTEPRSSVNPLRIMERAQERRKKIAEEKGVAILALTDEELEGATEATLDISTATTPPDSETEGEQASGAPTAAQKRTAGKAVDDYFQTYGLFILSIHSEPSRQPPSLRSPMKDPGSKTTLEPWDRSCHYMQHWYGPTASPNPNLGYREIATEARQTTIPLLPSTTGARIQKGAFPSFNPGDSNESGKASKASHKRKNSTLPTEKAKCRLCHGRHHMERCAYIMPHLAPEGFQIRDHVRERVDQKIASDSSLKAEVERIQNKRTKNSKQQPDAPAQGH